jgi:hypothetical protein
MITETMGRRFRLLMSLLDGEPDFDPSVAMFRDGLTVNQVVSRLAPELGGPALVVGQQAVQEQVRNALDRQAAVIHEQLDQIEQLETYAGQLLDHITQLEAENTALRRALAAARQIAA